MKKLLLALLLCASTPALAQNVQCPTRPFGDSTNACASTAFVQAATAASALTVGVTVINGGTSGRVLYDNAGVLGEATVTGTLGSVVLSVSPTVTGSFTVNGNSTAPPTPLSGGIVQIQGANSTSTTAEVIAYASGPIYAGRRANGTAASPSALLVDQNIGVFAAYGYGATGWSGAKAAIQFRSGEAWSDTAQGTYIRFVATPNLSTSEIQAATLSATAFTLAGPVSLVLSGSTSGDMTIKAAATVGGSFTITLPKGTTDFSSTGGTSQVVKQTSAGAALTVARLTCADLSDAAPTCSSGAGGSIVVGTTTIGSGTTTRILYDNAGTLGEYTISGSGTIVAMATGPSISDLTVTSSFTATGLVTNADLRNSGALSVIGRSANSSGAPADISCTAASDGVLRESGSVLGCGTVATAGIANNAVTLAKLATQATNTVLGNATSGTAVPTALAVSSCSTAASALIWTTNTGFGCNTSITAAAVAVGGITGLGTGVATALAINVGSAGAFVTFNGALGSPSSAGTLPAFTLGGTISGGGNQINNVIIGTSTPLAGTFTTLTGTSVTINANSASPPAVLTGSILQVNGANSASTTVEVIAYASGPTFGGRRANGTGASPTAVTADQNIFLFSGYGYGATTWLGPAAQIAIRSAENWSDSVFGSYIRFLTTPIGSASIAEVMRLSDIGNLKIGGSAVRGTTEGTFQLVLFNGTAPAGTLTNGVSFYSASGEARVMDSAGNSTLLSPHDRVTNEWVYDSIDTRTGKRLRIQMEKFVRALNERFGLDFVQDLMADNDNEPRELNQRRMSR